MDDLFAIVLDAEAVALAGLARAGAGAEEGEEGTPPAFPPLVVLPPLLALLCSLSLPDPELALDDSSGELDASEVLVWREADPCPELDPDPEPEPEPALEAAMPCEPFDPDPTEEEGRWKEAELAVEAPVLLDRAACRAAVLLPRRLFSLVPPPSKSLPSSSSSSS